MLYCNVGRNNKLCICAGRKPNHRRYRRALYFLTTTPYSTTFCRKTWHNRASEAAHAVTFDFSSGFYNHFPITGCRIRRFLCQNTSSEGFEPPKRLSSTSLVVFFMLHLSFIQRPASRDVNCVASLKTVKNSRKHPVIQTRPRLAKKKFPVRRKKSQHREWPSNQQPDNHNRRHGRRLFVPLALLSEPTLKRQYKSEEQVNASPSDLSSLHLPDESTNFDTTGPALIYFSHSRFMTASDIFMPSTAADVIPPA